MRRYAASMSFGYVGLLEWLLLLVTGLGLPFGVPPLPENPTLLRAAPDDCVAFVEWFGVDDADPRSRNATERLAAEPEIRRFAVTVRDALRAFVEREPCMSQQADSPAENRPLSPGLWPRWSVRMPPME